MNSTEIVCDQKKFGASEIMSQNQIADEVMILSHLVIGIVLTWEHILQSVEDFLWKWAIENQTSRVHNSVTFNEFVTWILTWNFPSGLAINTSYVRVLVVNSWILWWGTMTKNSVHDEAPGSTISLIWLKPYNEKSHFKFSVWQCGPVRQALNSVFLLLPPHNIWPNRIFYFNQLIMIEIVYIWCLVE